jgi:hypothetical protein
MNVCKFGINCRFKLKCTNFHTSIEKEHWLSQLNPVNIQALRLEDIKPNQSTLNNSECDQFVDGYCMYNIIYTIKYNFNFSLNMYMIYVNHISNYFKIVS